MPMFSEVAMSGRKLAQNDSLSMNPVLPTTISQTAVQTSPGSAK
ncbi:MAG: hypothetical protein R2882_08995 [Gemmatimonadales bacterium]